jgi:UDP-glucose 4-epimerase
VVLGATGFIGRHLCRELVRRGQSVTAVSRRSGQTFDPGVASLTVADYGDLPEMPDATLVHLAGENLAGAVLDTGPKSPALRMAQRLKGLPFKRLVIASSAAVYGDKTAHPHTESEQPQPTSDYARQKLAIEAVFAGDPRAVIVRIANVYGPGMSDQNVLSDTLRQLAAGAKTIQLRDLGPVRDYIHVKDVIEGLTAMALGSASGVFNLSTGVGTSVKDLATLVCQAHGKGDTFVTSQVSSGHSALILSPAKAWEAFRWRAAISLAEGVKDLVP